MKYQKKQTEVDAIQFLGMNDAECLEFCPNARDPEDTKANLIIGTPLGEVLCTYGDFIVKTLSGGFYVSKESTFTEVYEV